MKKHHVFITIGLFVLVVGVYFFSTKGKVLSYNYPFDFDQEEITNKVSDLGAKGKEGLALVSKSVAGATSKVVTAVSQKSQEIISGIVDGAKKEVFKAVKNSVDKELDNITNSSGGADVAILNNLGIAFSIKTGTESYFRMRNKEDKSLTYKINWGDGENEEAVVESDSAITLSHKWDKEGEYLVEFKVISSGEEKSYSIQVTVSNNNGN